MDQTYGDFRARREATVWQRLNRVLKVLLFVAGWLVIISLFVPPYKKLKQSRAEIDNLQAQVNEQKMLCSRAKLARSICSRPTRPIWKRSRAIASI